MQYEIMRKITTAKLSLNAHEIWGDSCAIANGIYHIGKVIITCEIAFLRNLTVVKSYHHSRQRYYCCVFKNMARFKRRRRTPELSADKELLS